MLIIWKWAWENESSSTDHDSDDGNEEDDLKDGDDPCDGDDPECDQANTKTSMACVSDAIHTVIFKGIGSVDVLRTARDRLQEGFTVQVRLNPEPHNRFDSKEIAFQCNLDGQWKWIGYVVWEALSEVHAALRDNSITDVKFSWIKYIVNWTRSVPGYFAGVEISTKGRWGGAVVLSSGTH